MWPAAPARSASGCGWARDDRHRRGAPGDGTGYPDLVLPTPPSDEEKGSYAWRSLPFLAVALCVSAVCVIVAQLWIEIRDPIMLAFVGFTVLYVAYQAVSLPVNFAGHSFDLAAHRARVGRVAPVPLPQRGHLPADLRRAAGGAAATPGPGSSS